MLCFSDGHRLMGIKQDELTLTMEGQGKEIEMSRRTMACKRSGGFHHKIPYLLSCFQGDAPELETILVLYM